MSPKNNNYYLYTYTYAKRELSNLTVHLPILLQGTNDNAIKNTNQKIKTINVPIKILFPANLMNKKLIMINNVKIVVANNVLK